MPRDTRYPARRTVTAHTKNKPLLDARNSLMPSSLKIAASGWKTSTLRMFP
jgi:hypothetical protein